MGTSTASLTVGGNVVLNGTLTLSSASGGDINVGGNWTSTGTFTPNTRAVTFNAASGNQTITKSGGETFDYVIINKAAGNVVLANAITVNQTLTFTSGKLSLGANNLTFGSSGTTASASSSNYILAGSTGKVLKTYSTGSFTYPIGASATQYCPVTITNTGGVSQTYTVGVVTPTTYSPSTDAVNFDWSIGSTGSSASTLEFSWFTADASGSLASTPANGVAFQQNGSVFVAQSSSTSAGTPNVTTVSGVTSFTNTTWAVSAAPAAPTTQASNITFSSLAATSMTIGWTRGNGNSVAVFVKDGSGAITDPTDGTSYTASTTFGSGSQLGSSGYYCVLNGTGTSVNVTGLTQGHTYYVQAYEYNGTGSLIKYYLATATNNPNSRLLALVPTVTTGSATSVTTTTVVLNGTVSANGDLTTNTFDYGTTTGYGTNVSATPGTTSSQSVSTSVSVSSLTANTLYHFRAKGTNGEGTTNGSDATFTTISLDPSIGSTENSNAQTSANTNGFTAYWAAPSSQGSESYTYSLDYSTDNTFSTGVTTVNSISSGTLNYAIGSLTGGTTYYYRVKVVNAGGSSNYATSSGVTTTSTPDVDVADNATISAGNISEAANNNILASFSMAVTTANATLTALNFNFTNKIGRAHV